MNKELSKFKKEMREAFAEFYRSIEKDWFAGDNFDCAQNRIGKLLNVKKYADGSGYDFYHYRKNKK